MEKILDNTEVSSQSLFFSFFSFLLAISFQVPAIDIIDLDILDDFPFNMKVVFRLRCR